MKKLIILFFVITVSAMLNAQSQSADSVVFVKTMHDYGTISPESDGSYEFKFTNKGKAPLLINNVQTSCGCTVPEWPREPIQAGATGSIKVKYDTNRGGAFTKTISVYSNAVNSPVVLTIKGNVQPK